MKQTTMHHHHDINYGKKLKQTQKKIGEEDSKNKANNKLSSQVKQAHVATTFQWCLSTRHVVADAR